MEYGLIQYLCEKFGLADLYNVDEGSAYFFWGRINYIALIALFAGITVFLLLLNPYTLVGASIFNYTSASIPAMFTALAVHFILSKIIVIPTGKGGYK